MLIQELRKAVLDFMETNTTLHGIEEWDLQKEVTLMEESRLAKREVTWSDYLRKMRQDREWADELVVRSTAYFLGKDIILATQTHGRPDSWNPIIGRDKVWPFPIRTPPLTFGYLHERHFEPIRRKPMTSANECRGCNFREESLKEHITQTIPCQLFYSVDELTASTLNPVAPGPVPRPREAPRQVGSMKSRVPVPRSSAPLDQREPVNLKCTSTDTQCLGCSKPFKFILRHLAQTKGPCNKFYTEQDKKALIEKANTANRDKTAQRMREQRLDKTHRRNENEKQAKRMREQRLDETYRSNENKRERANRQNKYKKEKEKKFNESEYKRFKAFKNAIKDTWVIACLSCCRIMSTTAGRAVKLDKLKAELGESLFNECINEDFSKKKVFQDSQERVLLCSSCDGYLRLKKQMPPLNYKNGMEIVEIPTELELTDLEATLVAKRILFIKIFSLVKSRWRGHKDHTTNVPILDEDLLETYNKISSFPRQPGEAGLVLVRLKRKLQFSNHHVQAYICPDRLRAALERLKEGGHPSYQNITINNRFSALATDDESDNSGNESDSEQDDDDDDEQINSIKDNQLDLGSNVMLTDAFPESSVVINQPSSQSRTGQSQEGFDIAPGEGKIPTNLARDPNWDIDGFPHLFPDGKFGLNQARKMKLSTLKYLLCRLQSFDKRWCKNPAFVFACVYCIEREQLERQINISYMRGRVVQGSMVNLEEVFHVFDNIPGTFRYWQQRRYEVVAKLEQLGPFQFFFTLSCADKRWSENFVSILSQRGLKIIYEPVKHDVETDDKFSYKADDIWVQEEGKEKVPLEDYLENENLHELVRENILAITMNFDKRVHAFMNKIVMDEKSPMKTKFYHYRVEFQARGAGHIHGVLWVNLDDLEKELDDEKKEKFKGLVNAMNKLKQSESLLEADKQVLATFVDNFVTCSLDDPDLRDLVKEVQWHHHSGNREKKTGCYKKGPHCRFNYPRFPSKRTIIAQPPKKRKKGVEGADKDETEKEFSERKKKYKESLKKVKDVLVEIADEELQTISEKVILEKAGMTSDDYYEALRHSQVGACIILKRKPSEIYINNYNPEWIKAWDGNMDIALCLDFFAIITYITDYYTKSETEMMSKMMDAAKACKGQERREQLKFMVKAFLKYRVMGEMEAFYRIMPHLHLSESNLKCVYVATGFPENRSKFLFKVKEKLIDHEDDPEGLLRQDLVTVPGKEGSYKQKIQIHDKYQARPEALKKMCLAQFAIYYDSHGAQDPKKDLEDTDVSGESVQHKIISHEERDERPLPNLIKLKNKLGIMRLRNIPAVIRIHKLKEDKNPHEFWYSQLLLYYPWEKESELRSDDIEACKKKYLTHLNDMQETRKKLFPHKNTVEEGRALMDNDSNHRPTHIGDDLDAENEVENEAAVLEEVIDDSEFAGRYPTQDAAPESQTSSSQKRSGNCYKRIELGSKEERDEGARNLDRDQRVAFDINIENVKKLRTCQNSAMQMPSAPLLKVHGGAGAGKSFFINVTAQHCEYWMTFNTNKDPNRPSVVKVAPTGKAANIVHGLTLHAAFNFSWGNQYFALSDKLREARRSALENLTLLIIDEMSMVKADMLYQLHLRLQEIKQNDLDFGGVSVLLCGDLMQLKPVSAAWIFGTPNNEQFKAAHELYPLWELFQSIELTVNHRQGADREYGDFLNRLRIGEHTQEDEDLLATRLRDDWQGDPLYVTGKKAPARELNDKTIEKLPGSSLIMKATVTHPFFRNYKPKIDKSDGSIDESPMIYELELKVGARIMVTLNDDTPDELSNGTCGEVVGFYMESGQVIKSDQASTASGQVKWVLCKFDEELSGLNRRKLYAGLLERWGLPDATPIWQKCFDKPLGSAKKGHATTIKITQFPLKQAAAINVHKTQGLNVKAPTPLVADMDSCFEPAMPYVMLSRIQKMDQLYLISFNTKWMKPWPEALVEANKIKEASLASRENLLKDPWNVYDSNVLKMVSLNIQSLPSNILNLRADPTILEADIICLQETFLHSSQEVPTLSEEYVSYHVGEGQGKGVLVYIRDSVQDWLVGQPVRKEMESAWCLKMSFTQFDALTVYRSPKLRNSAQCLRFIEMINSLIDPSRPTVICGDFNYDYWKQPNDRLRVTLDNQHFTQIVTVPTTLSGNCIDHVYVRGLSHTHKMYYPYYTNHEAVCTMLW